MLNKTQVTRVVESNNRLFEVKLEQKLDALLLDMITNDVKEFNVPYQESIPYNWEGFGMYDNHPLIDIESPNLGEYIKGYLLMHTPANVVINKEDLYMEDGSVYFDLSVTQAI